MSLDPDIEQQAILAGAEVLEPHDAETERGIVAQMGAMYRRDRWMAIGMVALLVIVLPFIYIALWNEMPGTGTKVVLGASGVVLLVYNLASVAALVRNYKRDQDFIYRRDIAHLRELRVARRAGRERS
jgi:phosphatidylglycerophosphate synthase